MQSGKAKTDNTALFPWAQQLWFPLWFPSEASSGFFIINTADLRTTGFFLRDKLWFPGLMKIEGIIWLREVVDKLSLKHGVETGEVEEMLDGEPKIRFVESGERKGEDVYMALGQTAAGRYLAVLFVHKKTNEALILSARDMADKERRLYAKK